MALTVIETGARWAGGVLIAATLAVIYHGVWRGLGRPAGRHSGRFPGFLRSWGFYAFASAVFFGVAVWLWRPLPGPWPEGLRWAAVVLGAGLLAAGLGLMLWARWALGGMYFASTGFGAQLFAGHRLVTRGPFAWVRHPLYIGVVVAVAGGLLLYQTWTWVGLLLMPAGLWRRARREEEALAAEFGADWQAYCQRTPPFWPRWKQLFRREAG